MDYDNWNNLKKILSGSKRVYFSKGEIWFISIGKNLGDEEDGKNELFERPVLIIRKFNNNIFLGIPLTSQEKIGKYYITLKSFKSVGILSQIRLFDSKRLVRKIGKIDSNELVDIKNKVRDII
jgi:mRNA interferase MazF